MTNFGAQPINYDDYIISTAVFGEIKRTVFSKNFQGGRISNFLSATKVDLTKADINGIVSVDISQFFGEVKVFVPSNWQVVIQISSFFAEVNDRRDDEAQLIDPKKVLMLTGTSFFAVVKVIRRD
jgi:predicted membrane protein